MKIIAFSGRKQSGKDTVRNYFIEKLGTKYKNILCLNFADKLKQIILELFVPKHWEYTVNDFANEKNKSRVLPSNKTVRELLQWFGTDVCKGENIKCWSNVYMNIVHKYAYENNNDCIILTSDVRFPDEIEAIHNLGGVVIRLLRQPHIDNHSSETALDKIEFESEYDSLSNDIKFDYIIDNKLLTIKEQNEFIYNIAKEKGWL